MTKDSAPVDTPDAARRALSDLVDGRLDAAAAAMHCGAWPGDIDLRRTWHAYHLIGDVLRSDDLAGRAAYDAAFLHDVRSRLAAEPAILAPTRSGSRPAWRRPVTAAAGFALVAAVGYATLRQPSAPPADQTLATAPQSRPAAAESVPVVATPGHGDLQRGLEIEAYLLAHRDIFAGSPAALPGGAMRTVEYSVPQR